MRGLAGATFGFVGAATGAGAGAFAAHVVLGSPSITTLRLATAAGVMNQPWIMALLAGLRNRRSRHVKIVRSVDALRALFVRLSAEGKPVQVPTYSGTYGKLPDGTMVGLRQTSTSGGHTIQVFLAKGEH